MEEDQARKVSPALMQRYPPRNVGKGVACISRLMLLIMPLGMLACSKVDSNAGQSRQSAHREVNLLLVTIDTLRADYVSCYGGNKVDTPAIDGLAARGVRFSQAFAQVPLTPPSHACILTGTYPPVHRLRDLEGFVLDDRLPTLATIAQSAGFRTAAIVAAAVLSRQYGLSRGFDSYADDIKAAKGKAPSRGIVAELRGNVVTERAIGWLEKFQQENTKQRSVTRFFLWVHYFDPHYPHDPPVPYRSRYPRDPYGGEVAYVDEQFGVLLNWLSSHRLAENTLVMLLSDHGESLGEHGEYTHGVFLYDSTMHIPMILAGPGISKGHVITQQVRTIDVMPTLVDYLGLFPGNQVQGQSLMPAIADGKAVPTQYSYMETLYPKTHLGWSELRGMRTEEWKLILAPKAELFQLKADPAESRNLLQQYPAQSDHLQKKVWEVAGIPRGNETLEIQPFSEQTREELRSLGYASSGTSQKLVLGQSGPDPKDQIHVLASIGRADQLMAENSFREAASLLRAKVSEDPTNPWIYEHLVTCYDELGQLSEAIRISKQAIRNKADTDRTYSDLGTIYLRLGDRTRATSSMEQAARMNPADLRNLCNLATVYLELGREPDSERILRSVLAQDSEHAAANNLLGVLEVQRGHPDLARQHFEAAIHADPNLVQAYMNLGILAQNSGQNKLAISYFKEFLEKAPLESNREFIPRVRAAIADLERGN
ncbi:MAG TPA: sulfatase-like hydrolase/transferase [Terriglobia bacterium]|nr:sulfatase-like hydrolase/transferase [Terriglobia bacterium]